MKRPQKMKRLGGIFLFTWLVMFIFKQYQGDGIKQNGVGAVFLVLGLVFLIGGLFQKGKEQ